MRGLQEKGTYFENLRTAAVRSTGALVVLMLLPLLGYAVLKFVRRQPLALDDDAAAKARSATSHPRSVPGPAQRQPPPGLDRAGRSANQDP